MVIGGNTAGSRRAVWRQPTDSESCRGEGAGTVRQFRNQTVRISSRSPCVGDSRNGAHSPKGRLIPKPSKRNDCRNCTVCRIGGLTPYPALLTASVHCAVRGLDNRCRYSLGHLEFLLPSSLRASASPREKCPIAAFTHAFRLNSSTCAYRPARAGRLPPSRTTINHPIPTHTPFFP